MTKTEFASYLTGRGYPAENANGLVMVSREKLLTAQDMQQLKNLKTEAGYNGSLGYFTVTGK